jgi:pimeloyl-ACP methyl ester carboxylesterase
VADLRAESRDVVIEGKRLETLRYFSTEPSATIVMLHEGLGSIAMWRDFPEQLAQSTGCGVLLYSRYGHGKSQRLAEKRTVDFMHHEAQVVLPQLLDCFQIRRPILLGHSDGGSIALIYAGTQPDAVRALVLEAPHLFVEDVCIQSIERIGKLYTTSALRNSVQRYHDHPDEMFWRWTEIWLSPEFRAWNIEEYLGRITCPLLVIQGEEDEYGTVAQVQAITKRLPAAESLLIRKCGHAPHRGQAEVTLEAVSKFIARLQNNSG